MIGARKWIDRLREHLCLARDAAKVEGVHQVRVASRRLDAWLVLGNHRMLRDDLRWLRTAVGSARDLDVLIGRQEAFHEAFPEEFAAWLRKRREQEQARVEAAVDAERTTALLAALSMMPELDEAVARRSLAGVFDRMERRAMLVRSDPTTGEVVDQHLHGLRRSIRRTRFALEWLGEKNLRLVQLHDLFGGPADLVVLLRWLDESTLAGELAGFRAAAEAEMIEKRSTALAAWADAKPELEALRNTWT